MVITKWSNRKMHIPILVFDDKNVEKNIGFLAIFWKFNFFTFYFKWLIWNGCYNIIKS